VSFPTVLVVDDSPIDQKLVSRLLERAGLDRRCVDNGVAALQAIEESMPDLVLTDLVMPEMNGLSLVEAIRSRYPALPVVLMTAHGSESAAVQALRRGATSYVAKRELARELASTLWEVLELARPIRDQQRVYDSIVNSKVTYSISNEPAEVAALIEHLESNLKMMRLFDVSTHLQVCVSLREALANAVYHGNLEMDAGLRDTDDGSWERVALERLTSPPYCHRRVTLHAHVTRDEASYVVSDQGRGFDIRCLPDPNDEVSLEKAHGRGLILIRTFMDSVSHDPTGTTITMIKRQRAEVSA